MLNVHGPFNLNVIAINSQCQCLTNEMTFLGEIVNFLFSFI